MELGVIDYGGGNLRSLLRALQFLGAKPKTVSKPEDFEGLTHLAFPGQGSFGDSMRNMESRGLVEPLRQWLQADRPFFGICIGYQLLFEGSEESPNTPGLGILEGQVERFSPDSGLKIPHMGWNTAPPTDPRTIPSGRTSKATPTSTSCTPISPTPRIPRLSPPPPITEAPSPPPSAEATSSPPNSTPKRANTLDCSC